MKIVSLYFSPTGGGEEVAMMVKRAISGEFSSIDDFDFNLVSEDCDGLPCECLAGVPVIFTVPVYGGHAPEIALERMAGIRGDGRQPAIIIAVYGNRAFENALVDLAAFVRERGFVPVAAAAFPCEHSYSTPETPIAEGRPDRQDAEDALTFGSLVRAKLEAGDFSEVDVASLKDVPSPEESMVRFREFVMNYQKAQAEHPVKYLPGRDVTVCEGCGMCVEVCPTGAIRNPETFGDMLSEEERGAFRDKGPVVVADPSLCIKCCACVKACGVGAMSFHTPFALPLSENFSLRKPAVWLL